MRPFFSYYGSKWLLSKYYAPPQRKIVFEPFAGSACYCLYHEVEEALLYDLNPYIVETWNYLINASESDIRNLPDRVNQIDDYPDLPEGAKYLIGFWMGKMNLVPRKKISSWVKKQYDREEDIVTVWGNKCKNRIISQLPKIRGWQAKLASYDMAENMDVHYFIDPPYSVRGEHYPFGEFANNPQAYKDLAEWCRTRNGFVQVCEREGADWLPFVTLRKIISRQKLNNTFYNEVTWRNDWSDDLFWDVVNEQE